MERREGTNSSYRKQTAMGKNFFSCCPSQNGTTQAFEFGRSGHGTTLAHLISLGSSAELVDE